MLNIFQKDSLFNSTLWLWYKVDIWQTSLPSYLTGYIICVYPQTKQYWSKCPHGGWSCWICFAYGRMLGQDLRGTPQFEPKDLHFLKFGFGNCHSRLNYFKNLVKFAWNQDFKNNECRYFILKKLLRLLFTHK